MNSTVVIGGGLAGCAAAIHLARGGRAVTLVEREAMPVHKVCGEFLSAEACAMLGELGVDLHSLGAVVIDTVRLAHGRHPHEASLPFEACSLTRRTLDEALLQRAAREGVDVQRGVACRSLERIDSGWQLTLANDVQLRAGHALLATGKHDLRGYGREAGVQRGLIGFKMYFELSRSQRSALGNAVELHLFSGGYAGLQMVEGGVANLCCAVRADSLQEGGDRWAELSARMQASSPLLYERLHDAQPQLERPLAIAPVPYGLVRSESRGGLWRLGDQAAVIPSFTGDGMSIALWSGALAARMLLAGASAEEFQRTLASAVRAQVGFATRLSRAMVSPLGSACAGAAFAVWPGALRAIARRTRLRSDFGRVTSPAARPCVRS